jgi:hypothetical protein
VIPPDDLLEQYYEGREVAALVELRKMLAKVKDEKEQANVGRRALRHLWDDELTYICKTHWLLKQKTPGPPQLLIPNYAQRRFYEDCIAKPRREGMPMRGIILKARQLGFSTFIQSWQYEQCDRCGNRSALTLSYDDPSSLELFQKARHVHRSMWFPRDVGRDSGTVLEMIGHNSQITVRTSGNLSAGRGDTYHHLHCSEVPMWKDAGETLLSSMQAVPEQPETSVFIESTAKGAVGSFYDEWCKAERGDSFFVPFFAPWFWDQDYSIEFRSKDLENEFMRKLKPNELRMIETLSLTPAQMHWRRRVIESKCQGSEAKFRQEYPSTATEAFLTTGSPVFNADQIAMLEQNSARPLWTGDIHLEIV